MKRWYVVNTHPTAEHKAAWHLGNQGFDVYLPQYVKRRRHARRTEWVKRALFPNYLFVWMDVTLARWRSVSSTIGVRRLITAGEEPSAVPPGIVEEIRARESECQIATLERLLPVAKGTPVRIAAGLKAEIAGLFECDSDQRRVTVLLDILGRKVRARVPVELVSAYS
jgi:transcriptional antiterminator RfaH